MKLAKLAAISAGATLGIIILGAAVNIGFAIGAWKLNLDDAEIEDDGFITIYPPINRN